MIYVDNVSLQMLLSSLIIDVPYTWKASSISIAWAKPQQENPLWN